MARLPASPHSQTDLDECWLLLISLFALFAVEFNEKETRAPSWIDASLPASKALVQPKPPQSVELVRLLHRSDVFLLLTMTLGLLTRHWLVLCFLTCPSLLFPTGYISKRSESFLLSVVP